MYFVRKSARYIALSLLVLLAACAPSTDESAGPAGPTEGRSSAFAGAQTEIPQPAAQESAGGSVSEDAPFGDNALLDGLVPAGWKQAGPIEHYNVATLYNKIDGRSELYMAYDVRGLSWVSFVSEASQDDFLDLFVYDMRTPANAFGIYSVEREPGQAPAGLGRLSYRTGSNYYFWRGKSYGYMNASRENDTNTKTGLDILTALMQRLEDTGEAVAGMDLLPREGLIEDTVQYFKVDALSLDFLDNTWAGQYDQGDATVRAFISARDSADQAATILGQFTEYGRSYADSVEDAGVDGVAVTIADWGGGFFDAAFNVGPTFAGVSNVEGRETLDTAVATLIKQIKARG